MSEFAAEAQIVVSANTKPFVTEFNKVVAAANKTKVTVTVTASMTGFRNDLITKLESSKRGISVDVPVRPDMTGFRTKLQAAITSSTRGVFAEVGVKVGKATGAAAAAATGGGAAAINARSLTAEQATTAAVEAGLFARKQITGLIDEQDKRLARIQRQDAAILAAQNAQKKAITEQNAGLQRQAILVEQRARAEREITKGAFSKEADRRIGRDPTVQREAVSAAEAQAKAEITAQDKVVQDARKNERDLSEDRIAQREATVRRLLKIDKAFDDARITSQRSVQKTIENIRGDISGITPDTLAKGKGNEAAIRKQITVLTHAEKEAKTALKVANDAVFVSEARQLTALTAQSAALRKMAADSLVASAAQTKLGHTIDNVRRAIVAQVASMTGLRGAALTAATAFIATSAALISLKKAVDLAAKVEAELSVFQVTAGATADEMEHVHERAIELGKDITLPGVSAKDAAIALTELSKAGLSVEDSIDGAKGVLQLATAANINFEQATLLAANAINAFGLAGEDATHVADVLANSANESQGSIVDVGVAFQQSSSVIRQAGISFEEGAAALTLFARNGLRGSDAGTSLRTALIRLINPSAKAAATIKELGLEIRDSQGNIDLGVFQQFADATRDMTNAQRDQALAIIFGQDAIRGAGILIREGNAGLEEQIKNVNKAGTAAEVAAARTSGYAGAVENLKNQIEGVAEELGAAFLPALTAVVNSMSKAISTTDELLHKIFDLRDSLVEPFDVVVRFLGGEPTPDDEFSRLDRERGEETGDELAQRTFKTIVFGGPVENTKLIIEQFKEARKELRGLDEELDDFFGTNFASGTSLDEAREKVRELVDEIERADNVVSGGIVFPQSIGSTQEITGTIGEVTKGIARLPKAGDTPFELIQKGDLVSLNEAVLGLKDLQEELQGGDRESKEMAESIGDLITEIQEASTKSGQIPPIHIPVELEIPEEPTAQELGLRPIQIGVELDSARGRFQEGMEEHRRVVREVLGEGFHDAGLFGNVIFQKAFVAGLIPNMTLAGVKARNALLVGFDPTSLGDTAEGLFINSFVTNLLVDLADAAKKGADAFQEGADRFQRERRAAVKTATTKGENQVLGTERAQTAAQIAKDTGAELKALRDREMVLKRAIARIDKAQLGGTATDLDLQQRSDFNDRLNETIKEREGLEESLKADAESKKADIKKAQDAADQAVLDALFPATRALDSRALVAEGTVSLKDDIAVAKAQIKDNQKRIAVINAQFKDRKEAAKQIADIRDENVRLNQQIAADVQGIFDAQAAAFEVKVGAAAAEGNIERQISLTRNRIAAINKLIREGKAEGKALAALIEERRERRAQLEQLQDERLQAQLDFAQSIFDLTGNKNPLLRAIDALIAEATQDAAQAKRGSVKWLKAKTEINNLLKQRKEVLEGAAKDAKSGTSAFDLLSQFTDTFNQVSGNLINTQQPFVSPADFTSPIAPFLTRKPVVGNKFSFDTGGTPDSTDRAIERLIRALEDNTAATKGNSTANTGGGFSMQKYTNVTGQRAEAMAKFWAARGAREYQDSSPGRGGI